MGILTPKYAKLAFVRHLCGILGQFACHRHMPGIFGPFWPTMGNYGSKICQLGIYVAFLSITRNYAAFFLPCWHMPGIFAKMHHTTPKPGKNRHMPGIKKKCLVYGTSCLVYARHNHVAPEHGRHMPGILQAFFHTPSRFGGGRGGVFWRHWGVIGIYVAFMWHLGGSCVAFMWHISGILCPGLYPPGGGREGSAKLAYWWHKKKRTFSGICQVGILVA